MPERQNRFTADIPAKEGRMHFPYVYSMKTGTVKRSTPVSCGGRPEFIKAPV
ncbi:uncharacterized protein METZ01_LOCUS310704 [marine metagenome]|uniref:Uncharacterized protein n=1 Tax=marine metagenome TaxID=408172 RepID=A0A382NAU5_9ZZZZ